MSCNVDLNIARTFTIEPRREGHPLRTTAPRPQLERQHLLRRPEQTPASERRHMIRDAVISVFGAISACIPMWMALQTVLGA